MAEEGARKPAGLGTSLSNLRQIIAEDDPALIGLGRIPHSRGGRITQELRDELKLKGLKGFKRGGKVKKTGAYKLHKGEKVLTASQARKPAVKRAVAAKKAGRRR